MLLSTVNHNKMYSFMNNHSFKICLLFLSLYLMPMIILQENSHVSIHDNLNSEVMYRVIPSMSGKALSPDPNTLIENVMNGIPRSSFPSGLNLLMIIFVLFKPFTAYMINEVLIRVAAFVGMYILLRKHFLYNYENKWIIAATALCFAILPYYSIFGLTIAGQPLLLYAFLNLRKGDKRLINYSIIIVYPFYSVLVFSGIFILFICGIFLIYDVATNRRINFPFLLGVLLLGTLCAIAEYQLFYSMLLSKNYISHRTEFDPSLWSFDNVKAVKKVLINFFWGHFHSISLHIIISFIVVPCSLIIGIKKKIKLRTVILLIGIAFVISLFYGLYRWEGLIHFKRKIPILTTFQFDRFYFLQTTIWYIMLALSFKIIATVNLGNLRIGILMVFVVIVVQLLFIFNYSDSKKQSERKNDLLTLSGIQNKSLENITFKEFYSEDLFKGIKDFIGRPQAEYRVVSIALQPAMALYNGFYTLDMYIPNYPLKYKHNFRKIIARELDKNIKHKALFDNWGHICYIYVSEISDIHRMFTKEDNFTIKNLELDTVQLKKMGGEYIFSAVEILNSGKSGLELLRIFEKDNSPWRIYLYKVN